MIKKLVILGVVIAMILSVSAVVSANTDVNLPNEPVTLNVSNPGANSYFDTTLKNVPDGFDVINATYVGWCTQKDQTIYPNHDYDNTYLYSSYNSSMPGYLWHENWSMVNYIINNKQGSSWHQVQYAIWYVLDMGDHGLNSIGWSMVENATLHGQSYSPGLFDLLAVIADPGINVQRQMIELQRLDPNGDEDSDSVINSDEDLDGDNDPSNDDYDCDGIPNYLDPDDDNDGISTFQEIADGNIWGHNVDGDYKPNYLDTESDGDGKGDAQEGRGDQDGDGIPNYLDPNDNDGPDGDLDGDGLTNQKEEQIGTNKTNPDTDGDGLDDYTETQGGQAIDTDKDGQIDANDPDDDNDGIPTSTEHTDGQTHGQDVDQDGTPNYHDTDSDGDGKNDSDEGTNDDDQDGIPNYLDPIDDENPTKVKNLVVINKKDGKLSLSWDAAVDNDSGINHYEIFRDDVFLLNVTSTSYLDTGLQNSVTYTYKIRAVDNAGNKGEFSDPVSGTPTKSKTNKNKNNDNNYRHENPVANRKPKADANGPYQKVLGKEIIFDGSKSTDDHSIVNYTWDLGDGNVKYGETVKHIYQSAGKYIVTLTVKDSHGEKDSNETYALIIQSNRKPSQPNIIADGDLELIDENLTGVETNEYTFLISSTDEDNDKIKYIIEWGDSTKNKTSFYDSGKFINIKHTWIKSGHYIVNVTAEDENGEKSETKSIKILVEQKIDNNKEQKQNQFSVWLLLIAIIIAALFAILLAAKKRKKDEEEK